MEVILEHPGEVNECDMEGDVCQIPRDHPRRFGRRSSTFHDLHDFDDADASDITPLLLDQSLNEILRVPVDRRRTVGLTFCFLGLCMMLPWNFLVSLTNFWNFKFRDTSYLINGSDIIIPKTSMVSSNSIHSQATPTNGTTDIQDSLPAYLSVASNIPGAITTVIHSVYGQRVSVCSRMVWSLILLLVSYSSLLLLSVPNSDLWQDRYLHLVLLLVVLSNVAVNVLQGSLFGVSGRFPAIYAGYLMVGQAMGGVIPAAFAVILDASDVDVELLGPMAFGLIVGLLILALVAERKLSGNDFFLYFCEGKNNRITGDRSNHDAEVDSLDYKAILGRSWVYMVSVYLCLTTTVSIYPGLSSLIRPEVESSWTDKFFTPVACVLTGNLADLTGRVLATWLKVPGRSSRGQFTLLSAVIARTSLIPLFMLCNAAPESRLLPVVFRSDIIFIFLLIVLGVSVGYVGNLCMIQAPKTSEAAECQEATCIILTSCLVMGQATGSFMSYFLVKAL